MNKNYASVRYTDTHAYLDGYVHMYLCLFCLLLCKTEIIYVINLCNPSP